MNEERLKRILQLKMELAELVLETLPAPVQEPLKEWQRQAFQVLHDLSEDYLARSKAEKEHQPQVIKTIVVEE